MVDDKGFESCLMVPYDIPAEPVSVSEDMIKKSRFITLLAHTDGGAAAHAFVLKIRKQHHTARHHCWAWIAGPPDNSRLWKSSDDGEPAGTAGKPMLAQLTGNNIGEITAVVVRYYGGIQLGTGGLVKAYSGGVRQGLTLLTRLRKVPMRHFSLCCEYALLPDILYLIDKYAGNLLESLYGADVNLKLALPYSEVTLFSQKLSESGRGRLWIFAAE